MGKSTLTRGEYVRNYSEILGVNLGGAPGSSSQRRLAYSKNMYRDYEGENPLAIESIPGFRSIFPFGERINAIYQHKTDSAGEHIIVVSGNKVYRFPLDAKDILRDLVPIATLSSDKCAGFAFGSDFYILDGKNILKINELGIASNAVSDAYVPLLYYNGERYEQRNLLSDRYMEKYVLSDPESFTFATEGLNYTLINPKTLECAVTGIDDGDGKELQIPGHITIGGVKYNVTEIADDAFSGQEIRSVTIGEGVRKIGMNAFRYCSILGRVQLSSTVEEIGDSAFMGLPNLTTVFFGSGIKKLGEWIFDECESLKTINYALDATAFGMIEGIGQLSNKTIVYKYANTKYKILLPTKALPDSIQSLTVDGKAKTYTPVYENGKISGIVFEVSGTLEATGCEVVTTGTLGAFETNFDGSGEEKAGGYNGLSAVLGCTIAEAFDGRIFLSGNAALPNTVFYSALTRSGKSDPLYIGQYNYFNDGLGKYPVKALLAVRDSLAVFKAKDDGCGSIFYHRAENTSDDLLPRIYPVSYVHSGICCEAGAISFLDDPVFISKIGLASLSQKAINYERNIVCRSTNVNIALLKQDISQASLTEWMGYLVVGIADKVYLADSRSRFTSNTGEWEYEWFVLDKIGTWRDSTRIYRYATTAPEGFFASDTPDEIAIGTVNSVMTDTALVYYTTVGEKRIALYPTEERTGGVFSPACIYFGTGSLLFFGTEDGNLCLFNNDKRGVAPVRLKEAVGFDEEEYLSRMKKRIHPDFYAFDTHAAVYEIRTSFDECDVSHLLKNTVKNSLVVKIKTYARANIEIEVGTDRSGYRECAVLPVCEMNFDELDFSCLVFESADHFTLPVAEKEKNWIEKQIAIRADSFASPIGIYSISYRYYIKGRIKNK